MIKLGFAAPRAGKAAANYILQNGAKRANERGVQVHELGIHPGEVAQIARLKEDGRIGSNAADDLFGALCESHQASADVEAMAKERGLLIVRDDAALDRWCDQVIASNEKAAADVRGGKQAAVGRLVGEVMKLAGGSVDAKAVREALLKKLGAG
jgi:aspartyl-tRNA(Asn)/glutamyl-tRNA(Gln) amidotransferase subunit B